MMKRRKFALFTLIVLFVISTLMCMVACGGASAEEAIKMYTLPQAESLVDKDFTLPKGIGQNNSVSVQWKSSNTDAIAIEDGGETYIAKVTIQPQMTDVTLTISSGKYSKDFTVRVDGLSAFTFIDNFTFPQQNTAVKEDFTLETEMTFQGHKATISWSVPAEYAAYLRLDGNKVVVTPGEDIVTVKLTATFSYGEDSKKQDYTFSVAPQLERRQLINRMYSRDDYPLELSGYIVHVYQALIHETYGPEATFYMIDDKFYSGYYLYNVEIDPEQVDMYKAGAHVTVSGATSTNYNGLWENKSNGGLATIDDTTPINPRDKVCAIDTDILADAPSLLWRESTFVSLSGWKVLRKGNYNKDTSSYVKPSGADQNLFTLVKNEKEVVVRISKYIQRTQAELDALCGLYDTINEGDFIDVTGILGNYNGFQIQPIVAGDIKKVNAETTNTDGAKVKAAIAAVNEEVKNSFGGLITANKTVTMPTSESGVTISYRLAGSPKEPTVTINGGSIVVDPNTTEHNYEVEVTYSIGDYKAYQFFQIHNWKKSDADLVDTVKKELSRKKISEVTVAGKIELPAPADAYGTTIEWSVKGDAPAWITVSEDKAEVEVTALPDEETTITLTATITLGSAHDAVDFEVKVAAAPSEVFKAIESAKAGDYIFGLYQGNLKKWLYATGKTQMNGTNGPFGSTTEDPSGAAIFTLKQGTTGWTIQLKSDGKYLELNDKHIWTYVEESTAEWTWNEEHKVFTFNVGGTIYYLGTYSDFNTFSASTIDRLTGSNFAAQFGNMEKATDETRANEVLALCDLESTTITAPGTITLFTTTQYKATVEWTMKNGNEHVALDGTTLTISSLPQTGSVTATLHVKVTVGEATSEKDIIITVKALELVGKGTEDEPFTVADALAIGTTLSSGQYYKQNGANAYVYIEGIVTDPGEINMKGTDDSYGLKNVYIAATKSGADTLLVFNINWGGAMTKPQTLPTESPLHVGDKIVVHGYLQNYDGTFEVGKDGSTYPTITTLEPTTEEVKTFKPVETTAPEAGTYYIAMQTNAVWYYLTGQPKSTSENFRLLTTTDYEKAAEFTLTKVDGGYNLKCGEKWLDIKSNSNHVNSLYLDEHDTACVWVWESAQSTFSVTVSGTKYFLGSYGTFTQNMSASEFAYLTGDKTSSSAQYPARIGKLEGMNEQDKVNQAVAEAKAALDGLKILFGTDKITIPTTTVPGVTLTFKVGETDLANYTVTHGAADTTITVTITATMGTTTKTETATITIGKTLTAGTGNLELTSASITKVGSGSGYAPYNGVRTTTSGYDVYSNQVMLGSGDNADTIQFQASAGKIMVYGNFTKITIVFSGASITTGDWTVKAGDATLTAGTPSSENTLHTVEYTVTGSGAQLFSIAKTSKGAGYIKSITFTAAQA